MLPAPAPQKGVFQLIAVTTPSRGHKESRGFAAFPRGCSGRCGWQGARCQAPPARAGRSGGAGRSADTATVPLGQRGCSHTVPDKEPRLCLLRGDEPADRTALRAAVAEKARAGRAPGCAPGPAERAVPAAACCCAERGRTLGRTREKSRDGDEQEGEQHETGCSSAAPRGRGQPCLLPAGRERIKQKLGARHREARGQALPGQQRRQRSLQGARLRVELLPATHRDKRQKIWPARRSPPGEG